uniref:Tetratricopeptide repeat protein n=1 Tax=Mycena chlorophos TaxID=658473 RepID=A0ABQ0LXA5_MYCCL|nr:predicted protein [Mycena chlorophos]
MEMEFMDTAIWGLSEKLKKVKMYSEAAAWELLICDLLRRLLDEHNRSVVMPRLAWALEGLSTNYSSLGQNEDALRVGKQAVEFWRLLHNDTLLDIKKSGVFSNHVPFITALLIYQQLQDRHQHDTAVSLQLLEEAVSLARCKMTASLAKYAPRDKDWSQDDAYAGHLYCWAFFQYSLVLSKAKRPTESCGATVEGLHFILQIPKKAVDADIITAVIIHFISQLCMVCETGNLTLSSFSAYVTLLQSLSEFLSDDLNLARLFVRVLHAYVYLSFQESGSSSDCRPYNLRAILLEKLSSRAALPSYPSYHPLYEHFHSFVAGAISAFFLTPKSFFLHEFHLILELFMAHPALAMPAFEQVVNKALDTVTPGSQMSFFQYIVRTILNLEVKHLSLSQRSHLAMLLQRICVTHGALLFRCLGSNHTLACIRRLWVEGMLVDANDLLSIYLKMDLYKAVAMQDTILMRAAILWDLGCIQDASVIMRDVEQTGSFSSTLSMSVAGGSSYASYAWFPLYCRLRFQLLQRTGRTQELQNFLEEICPDPMVRPKWNDKSGTLAQHDLQYILTLLELVKVKQGAGKLEEALDSAQTVMKMCRRSPDDMVTKGGNRFRLCALVYALVALGKCLAAVGRHDEAIAEYRAATSICQKQEEWYWAMVFRQTRKEEILATAYNALLLATGEFGDGTEYEHRVVAQYRALIVKSPRHRLALADSLRTLARIASDKTQALAAGEEAVTILRELVETEEYLVPRLADALDELGGFLKGTERAAPVQMEAEEMRRRAESLSPPTDELFRPLRELRSSSRVVATSQMSSTPRSIISESESQPETLVDEHGPGDEKEVGAESSTGKDQSPDAAAAMKLQDEAEPTKAKLDDCSKPVAMEVAEPAPSESLKAGTGIQTPVEIRIIVRTTPADLLWWGLVVLLGGLVVVLSVSSKGIDV